MSRPADLSLSAEEAAAIRRRAVADLLGVSDVAAMLGVTTQAVQARAAGRGVGRIVGTSRVILPEDVRILGIRDKRQDKLP